jgi:hypothetical protein
MLRYNITGAIIKPGVITTVLAEKEYSSNLECNSSKRAFNLDK